MRLYVSMPTYDTPQHLLERAVACVLGQEGVDLRLVVVGDGVPVYLKQHPRLITYSLPENRGRYFADAVVLEALPDDAWWAPHDDDDVSDPDRFERLMRVGAEVGAVVASYWRHEPDGSKRIVTPRLSAPTGGYRHIATWVSGAYNVERARRSGGMLADVRVAYDTAFVQLVQLTGDIAVDPTPGFHWMRRRDSLSSSKRTGMRSSYRENVKFRLKRLYRDAYNSGHDDFRDMVRRRTAPNVLEQVDLHASVLRSRLE